MYKKGENMFTKADLKTGMVVITKLRNYLVLLNSPLGDILVREGGFVSLESYNDSLENNVFPAYSIIKVYSPLIESLILKSVLEDNFSDTGRWKVVYDRKEHDSLYIKEKLSEEQAKAIAFMLLNSAENMLAQDRTTTLHEDYDYWYGISNDWDVNIYYMQDVHGDARLGCDLFPVVNGEANTNITIKIK